MELKEFISNTLVNIQAGVHDAIKKASQGEIPGAINPVWKDVRETKRQDLQIVTFDIAVTVSESDTNNLGGGIKVMGIGLDGKSSEMKENSHTSRIQFTVPIILPVHVIKINEE